MPRPRDSTPALTATRPRPEAVKGFADLYWIPLGAGGHSVRFNGIVYEALSAAIQRRPRFDIYHCALRIRTPIGLHTVEMTPVPNRRGWERGVVVEGAVGARWASRLRTFRYEVRCWRDGVIPDLQCAIGGPVRLTDDAVVVEHILELVPCVPALTWGRDESKVGEMWTCNSIVSWVLTTAGIGTDAISPPSRGRAPGWDAGVAVAAGHVPAAPIALPGGLRPKRHTFRRRLARRSPRPGDDRRHLRGAPPLWGSEREPRGRASGSSALKEPTRGIIPSPDSGVGRRSVPRSSLSGLGAYGCRRVRWRAGGRAGRGRRLG